MNTLAQSIIALIEYHNQPTAFGWFRNVNRAGFYLQQLPLSEVDFAILMSDFFITFAVSTEHYDEERYFPVQLPQRGALAGWFTSPSYHPITLAMLCEAASVGRWPEKHH